ncbi:MAG: hypothetical protein ABSH01_28020 [Terriglobia bacterium]
MLTTRFLVLVLSYFLSSSSAGSGAPRTESISPKWSADLRTAVAGTRLGVIAGGKGHEYEYGPQTSLWFTDDDTVVVTFVIRSADSNPKLAHRGVSDERFALRLRAVFLDANSGRIIDTPEWPADSRLANIVAAHDGKFVTYTGEGLILYSPDRKELKKLTMPTMEAAQRADLSSSPTGKTLLYLVKANSSVRWVWLDTDTLEVIRTWEEKPRGLLRISDSNVVMTACTMWYSKCEPEIDIKGRDDTNWKRIEVINDRRHPPVAGFVDEDLLFLQGPSTRLLRTDGTMVMTEDISPQGCWGVGIVTSAGGKRFVIPSCRVKGRVESLDLSGYDELSKFLVYDAPFQGQSYVLNFKGPKIKMPISLAVSPDGSKLAVLNGESVYVFQLPVLR